MVDKVAQIKIPSHFLYMEGYMTFPLKCYQAKMYFPKRKIVACQRSFVLR